MTLKCIFSLLFLSFRSNAEFAKEAMLGQSLDKKEVLAIRWAFDDPNPVAQQAIEKVNEDSLVQMMAAKQVSVEAMAFQYPSDYQPPVRMHPPFYIPTL